MYARMKARFTMTGKHLNKAQVKKAMKSTVWKCPWCYQTHDTMAQTNTHVTVRWIEMTCLCPHCGNEWKRVYTLSTITGTHH